MPFARRVSWGLALAASLAAGTVVLAGELDELRESVRNPSEPAPHEEPPKPRAHREPPRERRGPSFECDDDEGWINSSGLLLAGYVIATPYWLPHIALGDDLHDHGFVVAAPYEDAKSGMLTTADSDVAMPVAFGRVQLDALTDFGDLWRVGGSVLVESPMRVGIDSSFGYWHERLERDSDALWLGDFNLVYRFAQSPRAQFRAGLGVNWLADDRRADAGVNFTYGFDVFPAKPWVLTETLDMGTLGSATLLRSQTTVGVVRHRWEVFTGFDYTRIGRTDLYGWMNGVRVRF